MAKQPGLVIDIRAGEELAVSGPARITLIHKSGQFARLRVIAARDVKIERKAEDNGRNVVPSMAT
ncbi:hypothetical protein BN948_01745 [Hydrogenophaga intermedia]|uniref:Uncharacterized protein n=1 Tax=Hydrogenophaga intermedia TaxID=65786 RepID=A0A1L1PPP8_HYDIT|nr:hypothetical protein [Hydrogenophaga intermedia]CDN87325.1 hypothetical protein BN948_01745 [Hydrogenophaga intermedia]